MRNINLKYKIGNNWHTICVIFALWLILEYQTPPQSEAELEILISPSKCSTLPENSSNESLMQSNLSTGNPNLSQKESDFMSPENPHTLEEKGQWSKKEWAEGRPYCTNVIIQRWLFLLLFL